MKCDICNKKIDHTFIYIKLQDSWLINNKIIPCNFENLIDDNFTVKDMGKEKYVCWVCFIRKIYPLFK